MGFSDDGSPVSSGPLLRNALAYAGALGLPVVDHPEEASLTAGAEANDGFVATVLGLKGWPAAAEEAAVARDIAILADVVRDVPGARLHLTHVSTAGALDLVRRAKVGGPAGDLRRDAAPPRPDRRVARRRAALGVGGERRPVGRRRALRGAVRDGAPRQPAAPDARRRGRAAGRPWSTGPRTRSRRTTRRTPRSTRTSSSGWRRTGSAASRRRSGSLLAAVDAGLITLQRAIEALTVGPARVLGAAAVGRPVGLVEGAPADLVVFDRSEGVDGLAADALRSRGKNSPLIGRELPGVVLLTIAGGRVAFDATA